MKALTLALILISIGVNAQYSNGFGNKINNPKPCKLSEPKIYIPATIMIVSLGSTQINGLTTQQRNTIAITGCLTSVATYVILSNPKHRKGFVKYQCRFKKKLTFWK